MDILCILFLCDDESKELICQWLQKQSVETKIDLSPNEGQHYDVIVVNSQRMFNVTLNQCKMLNPDLSVISSNELSSETWEKNVKKIIKLKKQKVRLIEKSKQLEQQAQEMRSLFSIAV